MADETWRTEADDEWLAERRSGLMAWLRRRFRVLGGLGGAVANADTGPYAGAPRDPRLRVDDDKGYTVVRYTTDQIAYTATSARPDQCASCGEPLAEEHEIEYVRGGSDRVPLGAVRTCRGCQSGSWLRCSRMPGATRARDDARRYVV